MPISRLLLFTVLLLAACAPQSPAAPSLTPIIPTLPPTDTATFTASPTATPTFTATPPPSLTPVVETPLTPTPGLVVHGHVRLQDGSGLAGVTICRNYASYNGEAVATTNADGYFQSEFAFILGDEMVGVWALASGYTFQPDYVRWRHYYGPEDQTIDFVASPAAATAVPPVPCS